MARRLPVGLCTLLVVMLAACAGPSYKGIADLPDIDVGDVQITEVRADGTSTKLPLAALPNKVLVLFFGFTNCPDICPTTMAEIRDARERLGAKAAEVEVAFVTVDRERDTPSVLTEYVGRYGFGTAGHALRPVDDAELATAIKPLFASAQVAKGEDGKPAVAHSSYTYVIDSEGRVVVEWDYGTKAKDMAHDLRLALK